jgi:radical SAM superfamily enzyme YgiQ (UPF0313 family)
VKITFVRPNMNAAPSGDAMEPLVFALLAGLTPPEVELALYDERVETIPDDISTDLVAMSVETYTARRAYQLADGFRQHNIPVVMGGFHPTMVPDESLEHGDAVVVGDAEEIWPRLVADAAGGRLQRLYRQEGYTSLDGIKMDRRIFQGKRYAPIGLVQTSRGCRFACDFCSIHAFYGSHIRNRPVAEVVAEIEALDRRLIVLIDDNIFSDLTHAEDLFRNLIPLRIHWASQVSLDVAANPGLLDLMARSGCVIVLAGFESLNEANLAQMKKKWTLKHGGYTFAVQQFRERGIMMCGTFVFGYDHDTVDAFDATLEFALRSKFCLAHFNPLTPTPGAPLYDRLKREGRLIHDRWWLEPTSRYGQATFHPRLMTADELTEGCFRARRQFNTYSAILTRALDLGSNCRDLYHLGLYLIANVVSRREIYRKQGASLGDT